MNLAGRISVGATPFTVDADTKRVALVSLPGAGNIACGAVYLDGLGGGSGQQVCRQVIYDVSGSLVAVSGEVVVAAGWAAGWVEFPYSGYDGHLALAAGNYYVGIHAGAISDVIRVYGDDPRGSGGRLNADTYSDGAAAAFGAATVLTADMSGFLVYFSPYAAVVPVASPLYFSRLPFEVAQFVLGIGGQGTAQRLLTVGWHYTAVDLEQGSNAIVRDGGPAADLLGKRIAVTTAADPTPRTVNAYVHALGPADLEWDLSLSRSLFARIALLAGDPLTAAVALIGDPS